MSWVLEPTWGREPIDLEKKLSDKNHLPNPNLIKPDISPSIDNSGRDYIPRPKWNATTRNYGEHDKVDTNRKGKDGKLMAEDPNIPFPSRVSNTFKMESITLDYKKEGNIDEQRMIISPIWINNMGSQNKEEVTGGEKMGRILNKWEEITSIWRGPLWKKWTKSMVNQILRS